MSEAAAVALAPPPDKRAQVETLLTDVFRLMDYPARLEFKDMPDGSLGVAVFFTGELPGITPGKRSYLLDCVQFWLNKVVNRPNLPRRWVNLGVDAFPEPRVQGQPREVKEAAPLQAAPAAQKVQKAQTPPQEWPTCPPTFSAASRTVVPSGTSATSSWSGLRNVTRGIRSPPPDGPPPPCRSRDP